MASVSQCPVTGGQVSDRFADAATLENPYPYYEELRAEAPVFFSPTLNSWVVSRFKDFVEIAQNPQLFSSVSPRNQTTIMASFSEVYYKMYEEAGLPPRIPTLVGSDGDTHRRYRQISESFFTPRAVKAMEAQLAGVVDELLDAIIDRESVDIYREFALLVPLYVICDVLGLPREHARLMQEAGDASTDLAGAGVLTEDERRDRHRTLIRFGLFLREYINHYRENPADNLISHLIHTPTRDGDHLSEQEIIATCTTLNVGGNETTTNGIGNALWLLLSDPETEAHLRANRDDIPRFVEEALRLESPVASLMRWATEDTEVGGVAIPKGGCLHLRIPAGNRDEEQFGCPASVDLGRPAIRNHLAFGNGVHYCLGVHLTRAEMRLALNRIFDRMTDMKIDTSKGPVRHNYKTQVRSLTGLPITFKRVG